MKYSLTKGTATNVVALRQKDSSATPIEVSKNPGNETVTFSKAATVKARLVKKGGGYALKYEVYIKGKYVGVINQTLRVMEVPSGEECCKCALQYFIDQHPAITSSE